MERDKLPCAPIEVLDRERFEKVWRRVMPEDRLDCPFTLYGEGEEPEHRLMPPDGDTSALYEEASLTEPGPEANYPARTREASLECVPMPAMPAPAPVIAEDVPLLGSASAVYGELLQRMIADELSDARTYHNMSRRVTGNTARVLAGISTDERRHAKRLSVAYFLISGIRYWPEQLPGSPMSTFMGGARARFIAEQRGEAAYRQAAVCTNDPSLRELFLELAADEAAHAWLLRGILEQL